LKDLKEEISTALNDTANPSREVSAEDITVYKRIDGVWTQLEESDKGGKRARETTLEDLDLRGIGSGSTVDDDGEVLGYTVENGIEGEDAPGFEAYPRED
jgi:hypothetical protein